MFNNADQSLGAAATGLGLFGAIVEPQGWVVSWLALASGLAAIGIGIWRQVVERKDRLRQVYTLEQELHLERQRCNRLEARLLKTVPGSSSEIDSPKTKGL